MKIRPTLDEVKTIALAGGYDVLPVSCEILADICTPIEALKILKTSPPTATCWKAPSPAKSGGDTPSSALTPKWRSPARMAG